MTAPHLTLVRGYRPESTITCVVCGWTAPKPGTLAGITSIILQHTNSHDKDYIA